MDMVFNLKRLNLVANWNFQVMIGFQKIVILLFGYIFKIRIGENPKRFIIF